MLKLMRCSEVNTQREIYTTNQLGLKKKSQICNLILNCSNRKKEEQTKPKVNKRKRTVKIRAEMNDIEIFK